MRQSQQKNCKVGDASHHRSFICNSKLLFLLSALFISACNMASARDNDSSLSPTTGTLPFQISKQLDSGFSHKATKLEKVYGRDVSMLPSKDLFTVELYKEKESPSDGPEWDYKAIVRVGDYYYPLALGAGHTVSVVDVKGNQGLEKVLVIATGCFTDAGCEELTYVIRVFADQPFTLTKFDGVLLERKKAISAADFERLRSQGVLLMHFYTYIETEGCALEDSAFEFNGRGFRKIWNKREKVECAG